MNSKYADSVQSLAQRFRRIRELVRKAIELYKQENNGLNLSDVEVVKKLEEQKELNDKI